MKNRQRPFTNQVSFEPSLNKSEFLIAAGSMTADALKLRPKTGSSYQTTVPAGNRQLLKASLGQVALITWALCSSGLHSTSTRKLLTAESRNKPSCSQTREAVVHMEQIRPTERRHKHRVSALPGVLATTAMRIPTRVGFAPLSNVTGNDSHYQYCVSHDVRKITQEQKLKLTERHSR